MKEVINSTRRPLPYGFYTRKHLNTFLAIFLGLSLLSIFVTILMYKNDVLNHPFLYIFIELIFLLIAFGFAHLFGNPSLKALKRFYKTGNFDKLRRSIGEMLKYKMNGETSKELILTMLRYLYLVNASEADNLFVLVLPPKRKYNKFLYSQLKIRHLILTNKLDEAKKELDKVNPKILEKDQEYIQLTILYQIARNKIETGEVVNNLKNDSKYIYINVRNSYTLMRYYQYYSDYKKAKEYAKYVRDNGKNFYEYVEEADELLRFQPKNYSKVILAHDTNAVSEQQVNVSELSIDDLAVEKEESTSENNEVTLEQVEASEQNENQEEVQANELSQDENQEEALDQSQVDSDEQQKEEEQQENQAEENGSNE